MQCCFANPEPYVDPDAYYEIKPECRDDVTVSRFKPQPGRTLSPRRWQASFSPDGHLDIVSVLKKIQVGGVHPKIKGEVWEFLLGCYDPNSTFEQRNQLRLSRRLEYERLKNKCKEMDKSVGSGVVITMPVITDDGRPVQVLNSNNNAESALDNNVGAESALDAESAVENAESAVEKNGGAESAVEDEPVVVDKDVVQWKLSLHQIGLDVVRTDRSLVYYEDPLNRARLWDLLAVYSWIDGDIGYCQGMSDLCSPISILIESEADAFWCFERLMRRLRGNFKSTATSIGVRSQLTILANIIKAVDPRLHEHIENLDGGEYLFAFRMLMVLFRREFSFVDSLYLWELMWGMEYNPNMFALYEASPNILAISSSNSNSNSNSNSTSLNEYGRFEKRNIKRGPGGGAHHPPLSIFLVAGVLEAKSKRLLKETKGLDDVVKILNDITGNIDAKKACKEALKVHNKYLSKVKVS